MEPQILTRGEHNISRANISDNALKVLYRLKDADYAAYLVGGAVRDLLLGLEPKDFDLATNAHPDQIDSLFRNCRLIGRRFRLAHVRFRDELIEVATFRAAPNQNEESESQDHQMEDGRIVRDNVYGTMEEDVWRRDFSVNALYYNIKDFSVVDYVGGVEDLKAGIIRLIGDPNLRYHEDPVRMLRAVRFAAKLGFRIEEQTEQAIFAKADLLEVIPAARLFDEVLKLFLTGVSEATYKLLQHYGLFQHLFPQSAAGLAQTQDAVFFHKFICQAFHNTDLRIAEQKPVTPAFLYAALLWQPFLIRREQLLTGGLSKSEAHRSAAQEIVTKQAKSTSLPKRFSIPMREIWDLQHRFTFRKGARPWRLYTHPRFRAAYDFMLLRNEAGEPLQELCDWWTVYQEGSDRDRRDMVATPKRKKKAKPENDAPPTS